MTDVKQFQIRVTGLVQGVGYRYACRQQAEQLGIHGWVRNCGDGAVEACIQGSDSTLEVMLHWIRQGPDFARVDRIEVVETAPDHALQAFTVRFDGE